MRIFPDPLYYQEGQLLGVKQLLAGRPRLLTRRSVVKVNLIFYKLNLFPIFHANKVKKKKQKKDHEEFFYYHSGRCHAMRIPHQYANLTRILQF